MKPKRKRVRRPSTSIFEGLSDFGEFNGPAAEMGLAVLSALSVVGIHSAVNPDFTTLKASAKKPAERENATQGLWIGLGLGTLASLGLFFMFKKWLPAVIAEVTALSLFGIGMVAVNSTEMIVPLKEEKVEPSPATAPATTPAKPAPAKDSIVVMDSTSQAA